MKNNNCVYITVTMPPEVKEIMDEYAEKNFMSRSEFVRNAIFKYIEYVNRRVDKLKLD